MADATLKLLLLGEDRSAGKTLRGVGDDADKSASKFHGFAKAAGTALAGGLLVAGAAALKFAKGAADDEQAASKLAQTMHKAAGATDAQVASTEDWITAQGKAFGVTDDELRPALSKLVVATHDVAQAQNLASLAMDVSAGTGKSLEAVSAALAKAQTGNLDALGRLGVATKDADGKTKSLHQITKDLAATYSGAAANAADTTAGKQRILTTQLSEAGETIGYKLLPFMLQLTDAGVAALGWMTQHGALVRNIAIGAGILAAAIGALRVEMMLAAAVSKVMAISQAAQAVAAGTATEAQIALNAAMRANVIGIIITVLALLVGAIILAYKHSETFRDIVNGAFHAVGTAIVAIWNSVIAPVFQIWIHTLGDVMWVWSKLLQAIGHVPGMGWVGDLGDKLAAASAKARDLNLHLDVLDGKTVKTSILVTTYHKSQTVDGLPIYTNATGTNFFPGGVTRVGERGPEDVYLPRGSQILTNAETMRQTSASSDLGTFTVVVQTDDGTVMERKLAKIKRSRGGLALAFEG